MAVMAPINITLAATTQSQAGVDVSHWQGPIKWAVAKAAGIEFAFIKCTQGTTFFDGQFTANWSGTKAQGIPRGAYHWYEPELNPISQMEYFWNKSGGAYGDLPHVLDIEDANNIPTGYGLKVKQACEWLFSKSGKWPIIYTSKSYWAVYLAAELWADKCPLWVAHYKDFSGPYVPLPWMPTTWAFWQWTAKGNGPKYGAQSASIDLDVSNGPLIGLASDEVSAEADRRLFGEIAIDKYPAKPTLADYLAIAKMKLRQNPRGIPEK